MSVENMPVPTRGRLPARRPAYLPALRVASRALALLVRSPAVRRAAVAGAAFTLGYHINRLAGLPSLLRGAGLPFPPRSAAFPFPPRGKVRMGAPSVRPSSASGRTEALHERLPSAPPPGAVSITWWMRRTVVVTEVRRRHR